APRRKLPRPTQKQLLAGGAVLGALLIFGVVRWWVTRPAAPPAMPAFVVPPSQPASLSRDSLSHLQLAGDYQRKLWCSDALEELERAVRSDPAARSDPETARVAVACLTPKTREKAIRFIIEKMGPDARPLLERAAAGHA